jgi:hypothetical protein
MAADYVRGDMDMSQHESTFHGFMAVSTWGSLLTGLTVLYLTLAFAVGIDWLASLVGVAVVGVVAGLILSMKTSWYVTVGGLFVFGLICGGVVQLFRLALGG